MQTPISNSPETAPGGLAAPVCAPVQDPHEKPNGIGPRTAPKPLSLRQNISWTFVSNVVYAGCQWGILMVLAKVGSPETVGLFGLALAVTAPVIIFAELNLRLVHATDAASEYDFSDYFGLRIASVALAVAVIVCIAALSGYDAQAATVIVVVGIAKGFEAISDILNGVLQQRERMDRLASLKIIKGFLTLVAVGAVVWLSRSIVWGAIVLAAVWLLMLVLLDHRSAAWALGIHASGVRPRWRLAPMWRLTWSALPLGFVTLLNSLTLNIPRYSIEQCLGASQLGIFVAAAAFMRVGDTAVGAMIQSASPRLGRLAASARSRGFRRLVLKIAAVSAAIGAVGVLAAVVAGRQLLALMYTREYAAHADLFAWLMVAATMGYVASLDPAVIALKRYRTLLIMRGVSVTTVLALAVTLVPRYGLLGAAYALVLANTIRAALTFATIWWFTRAARERRGQVNTDAFPVPS